MLEIYVHISKLNDLFKGVPVNCKINYADQYDIKLLINPKKYVLLNTQTATNIITIRQKTFLERLGLRKIKTK